MEKRHSLTKYTIILSATGLAINLLLSQLVLHFKLPLFLDSVGTILASILGGYLPGIFVGFVSNVINGISDPITMYYALINIFIACAAAYLARRGWFEKLGKSLLSVLVFSFIGGCLGSVLTWLLYGFSFGSGISAPFAIALHGAFCLPEFYAQFTADVIIDLFDKLISVLICFIILRLLPASLLKKLSYGLLMRNERNDTMQTGISRIRHSLRGKVVLLIFASAVILSVAATLIGAVLYTNTMTRHYEESAASVSKMQASVLDPDRINEFLASGVENDEYLAEEEKLKNLRDCVPDVEYLYVYQIREDGCHVVFDIDTPELIGGTLGDVIPMEEDFLPYRDALLAGESIPPLVSNGAYGWLLTVYTPMVDSFGETVAYAAADISMNEVLGDRAIFVIKVVSLLFGASILIVAFSLWFAERQLVDPINAMAEAAADFAYNNEKERLASTQQVQKLNIHTGDEIENLYNALNKTVSDVSTYISNIRKQNRIIAQMQQNIIFSFASMVESRDMNTGEHIKHTAGYVGMIARELSREGKYTETITPEYIDKIIQSAPLHDLGKIEVPDAILNKPGKLTPEEFEKMKIHTTVGRSILLGIIENSENTDYLSEAVNMASYHHERWDGKGYPDGLCGEEIPISARIMAVADVYDALISKRSYKSAMPSEEAFSIIRSESGTHFDPVVVDALLNAREEIETVAL